MIGVRFKNLRRSEFIEKSVQRFFEPILLTVQEPDSVLSVTVEMQNSPLKAGKDHFVVKCRLLNTRYSSLFVSKTGENVFEVIQASANALEERFRKQKKKSTSQRRLSS